MFKANFKKSADPTATAENLISALKDSTLPINVEGIALNVGIQDIIEIESDEFEGLLVALPDKSIGYININKNIRENSRRRFTIAHELGHFLITTHKNEYNCSSNDMNNFKNSRSPQEIEANQFAAELLMPKHYFINEVNDRPPSAHLVNSLTSMFETSLQSTLVRYTEMTQESIAVVLSENLKVKWALRSNNFKYYIESQVPLSPDTYAYDFFNGDDLPSDFQEVEKDAWFDTSEIKHFLLVKELSFPLHFYNQVVSIVWVDEDEEEIEYDEEEFDGYLRLKR